MFSLTLPAEVVTLTFDFAKVTSAPLGNPVVTVVATKKPDPNASDILLGAAVVSGSLVMQQVTGGLPGVFYDVFVQVDKLDGTGDRPILWDTLPVAQPS